MCGVYYTADLAYHFRGWLNIYWIFILVFIITLLFQGHIDELSCDDHMILDILDVEEEQNALKQNCGFIFPNVSFLFTTSFWFYKKKF